MTKEIRNPYLFGISLLVIVCFLLYYLAPICMPFLAAAIIAYLSMPLVRQLERLKIPHVFAVIMVFFFVFFCISLFFLLFIPLIQSQVVTLAEQTPQMINWLETQILPWFTTHLGIKSLDVNDLKNYIATNVVQTKELANILLHSGKTIFHLLLNIVLIPVVTFYFLRDWDLIINNIYEIIPKKYRPVVLKLVKECDGILAGFFKGQLLVMLVLAIFYAFMLSVYGLQLGIIIGLIIGIASIVPYLGLIVGLSIASLSTLVQFGTFSSLAGILVIFLIGHALENFYLTPKLIGDRIGLHPVVVIFAILAGGALFGFFGVLLALPVAAVILVLMRHAHEVYSLPK